jgi:nucleolin
MPKRPAPSHVSLSNKEEEPPSEVTNAKEEEEEEEEEKQKTKKRVRKRRRAPREEVEPAPSRSATEDANAKEEEEEDELSRTIYLEGIPFAATREQVLDFLTQPLSPAAPLQVRDLRLPQWQDTGRLRGYGHAVLASVAQCQSALQQLQRRTLGTRYITVAPAVARETAVTTTTNTTSPPTQTLVLRNVPYDATEETLQQVFAEWPGGPRPREIRVVRHYAPPHRSKGLAYVEFDTVAAAQVWMEQRPHEPLQGRTLLWDYDQGRVKASFRDAERRHYHPPKKEG